MAFFVDEFPQRLAPGERVIIQDPKSRASAMGALGKVHRVYKKPKSEFLGDLVVEVEFENPESGALVVRPMAITSLRPALPETLRAIADKYHAQAFLMKSIAEEAETMLAQLEKERT